MSATLEEPFVHIVEVWVPDGPVLRLRSAAYGRHTGFGQASEGRTFQCGEGLPGAAWEQRRPVIWSELDSRFVRSGLAEQAGIEAGLAFPIFQNERLTATVVMLCGSRERTGGCIEVWQPNDLRELALSDGYYGQLESFAAISKLLRFQRGRGLPGMTWERGAPYLMPELASSSSFVRAAAARTSGVHTGLGIPLYRGRTVSQVLLLLSAHATPLARAFEVWTVTVRGELMLEEHYYMHEPTEKPRQERAIGGALAKLALTQNLPVASATPQRLTPSPRVVSEFPRCELGLAIPIHDGDRVRSVVTLLG